MNMNIRTLLTRTWSAGAVVLATILTVTACSSGGGGGGTASLCGDSIEASLDSATRIGGATTTALLFDEGGEEWSLYNVANELRARPVSTVPEDLYYDIEVPGYIEDIDVVTYPEGEGGVRYALLSMGTEGIAVVNMDDPTLMTVVTTIGVNYEQTGITWADGGGNILADNSIASDRGAISSLAVYAPPGNEAPLQLIIANESYGLHKTALSNLLPVPVFDADQLTLLIESEIYTLQYAGEVPWGGPMSLTLYGSPQRLFVAMGYLGMGIYNPENLEQVGNYNLYTDAIVEEDWFIDMDVSAVVQDSSIAECDVEVPGADGSYLDADTGMPNYRQVCFEIREVWKGDFDCAAYPYDWCTPWAAFDRYGKDYYKARAVDVATFTANGGGGEPTTIAYIAYGLGGLVAVDVTGYDADNPRAEYLGYAPAVPAKGPDLPTGTDSKSLFPHFGSGMLKEAGVIAVRVRPNEAGDSGEVYFSDHFAGLVVLEHAEAPQTHWRDPSCPCDNNVLPDGEDANGVGDHWPDYEFVTSYEFGVLADDETPPAWMIDNEGPDLLVTGEVGGHGNAMALSATMNTDNQAEDEPEVDVLLAAGAGGMNFMDILNLVPGDIEDAVNSYTIPVALATTDEVGADVNGLAYDIDGLLAQPVSIGHTEGVDAWHQYLFVADGPHGMSAWKIADRRCRPTDDVHLVANTLQAEYPEENIEALLVFPTPHAYDVVLDIETQNGFVLSQSLGLRRVSVADVQNGLGQRGSPLLMQPRFSDDIFEHSVDAGDTVDYISRQDHAYDVTVRDNLAFVSDGSNGLTVYDLNVVPDYATPTGDHIVSSLGAGDGNPLLGRATAAELWTDPDTGTDYAFVAAGHAGIAVVDITEVENADIAPDERMVLIKRFEPIKVGDEEEVGKADGRSVDVKLVGDYAYFTYDSFGIVAYRIDDPDPLVHDLISPLPEGTDPTEVWKPGGAGYDYRPEAVARFKLQDETLGGLPELAGWKGGALGMDTLRVKGKQLFYVAYGDAGVIKIDWTNPAAPVLKQHLNTVGDALDVTVENGRAYVADNLGGLALIK